jgi:dienelactone hydrolase
MFVVLALSLVTVMGAAAHTRPVAGGWEPIAAPEGFDFPAADWIKIQGANGHAFVAAVLRPEGTGPFPVVVLLHGAGGFQPAHVELGTEVAGAGFLVVAGCWQAIASPPAPVPNPVCTEATPQLTWQLDPATNSGHELIAAARTLPDAQSERVGLYGISRGGHAALWAASAGAGVRAIVADAPANMTLRVEPAPPSTLDALIDLAAPVLIMHGTADPMAPVEHTQAFEEAASALGKPVTVVYFEGIGHQTSLGTGRAPSPPASQAEARQLALTFLQQHLLGPVMD